MGRAIGTKDERKTAASREPRQTALLILGMHRSGTSLLSSLVQSLGINIGDRLVCADMHNPAGYFEIENASTSRNVCSQPWGNPGQATRECCLSRRSGGVILNCSP